VSVNKPPSVIAYWQALYVHSKSPHSFSLSILSGAITTIYMDSSLLLIHVDIGYYLDGWPPGKTGLSVEPFVGVDVNM